MSFREINGIYLADTARVTGEVTLGGGASVWYSAVIRGDVAPIAIGPRTNVQDGAIIHCDSGVPNIIGADVTIGHGAIVHGAEVGDGTLIGMGATVLGQTRIGRRCLIAAGAVVPPGLIVPDGHVVMGLPGRIARPLNEKEEKYLDWLPAHYVELARKYVTQPDAPTIRPYGS